MQKTKTKNIIVHVILKKHQCKFSSKQILASLELSTLETFLSDT
jgi:hypothetical protein